MTGRAVAVRPVATAADWSGVPRAPPGASIATTPPSSARSRRGAARDRRHPPSLLAARRTRGVSRRRNGRVVGRVAAIIDRLHNEHYGDRTGFFGFFECEDDPEAAAAPSSRPPPIGSPPAAATHARSGQSVAEGRVRRRRARQRRPAGDHDGPHAGPLRPAPRVDRSPQGPRFPRLRPRQAGCHGRERELDRRCAISRTASWPAIPSSASSVPRSRTSRRRSRTSTNSATGSARRCGASRQSRPPNSTSSPTASCG